MTDTAQAAAICPNCGTATTGRYCSNCGQPHDTTRTSVTRIIRDVLDEQLSLNGTLPRTLGALMFRPGRLTREYFDRRIARYVQPFKLYLVTSIVFFLALSLYSSLGDAGSSLEILAEAPVNEGGIRVTRDVQPFFGVRVTGYESGSNWTEGLQVQLGNERLDRAVSERLRELGSLPPDQAYMRVLGRFAQEVPKVMFLMLPLYALLLKLLYVRRDRYYAEHFIFALHMHAFIFIVFLLALLLRGVPVLPSLLLWWIPVYGFIALKRVYEQGWGRTIAKGFVLGTVYTVTVVFGVLAGIVLAVFAI